MDHKGWPPEPDFPERLFMVRRHRKVDNAAIAEAAGVAPKTVSHWIGGQKPDPSALLALARYFNVRPEWLLEGEGPPAVERPPQSVEDAPQSAPKLPRRHRDISKPQKPGRGEKAG